MKTKIVIIGSGSQFTEFFLQEIFKYEEFKGITLALVDRKPQRLEAVKGLAEKLNENVDWGVKIEGHSDRLATLPNADYVYCFAAVESNENWQEGFDMANKFGFKSFEAYTAGPPGLGMAMRHVPLVLDICTDMEKICPDAWLILDNNPLAKITSAIYKYSNIKVIGYCNGHELVQMGLEQALGMTDRDPNAKEADAVEREFMVPAGTIDVISAGINHLQWVIEIKSTDTGEDLYPKLRELCKDRNNFPAGYKFSAEVCRLLGYFPTCADNHVSDYLWFVDEETAKESDLTPYPVSQWFGGRGPEAWVEISEKIKDKDTAKHFISQRRTGWWNAQIVRSMMNGSPKYFPNLNILNNGAISNLSDDIIVELPGLIGPDKVLAAHIGKIPENVAPYCQLQGSISNLSADAAATGSKDLALQALMMDPFVNSMKLAKRILDYILEYNKKYNTRF